VAITLSPFRKKDASRLLRDLEYFGALLASQREIVRFGAQYRPFRRDDLDR
jgi:hypothetical protein